MMFIRRCKVTVANSAGSHTYQAVITGPGGTGALASSTPVSVTWVPSTVTLRASTTSATSGEPVMLTAHANENVGRTPWVIIITDLTTGAIVGFCGDGSKCSTWVSHTSGTHTYRAVVAAANGTNVQATSVTVTVTWPGATSRR
jgi:hypothetical protein